MPFSSLFRLDLRRLIMLLAFLSGIATLSNTFYASYQVQREALIQNTLEANRVYATKLAASIEEYFEAVRQQLGYSAALLSEHFSDETLLRAELARLKLQTDSFNSVFAVDAQGTLLDIYPETLSQLRGIRATSQAAQTALSAKIPLISEPYQGASGYLLIAISSPVWTREKRYLGYISGTLYLEQPNMLSRLLGEHYYRDGSYLYVAGSDSRLIHHVDPKRIGERVPNNPVIKAVLQGETGSMQLINSQGVEMLAGYAPIPSSGWGVVAQRPLKAVMAELDSLMWAILYQSLPWAVVGLMTIYLFARLISQPLWQLARGARSLDAENAQDQIQQVKAWYFEAAQLKRAVLAGFSTLRQRIGVLTRDVLTDPLTGLYNRRGLRVTLDTWQLKQQGFAIIALDIDHFKQVNDTYGHDMGDQVLKYLATVMQECSRTADLACRNGGEEFLLLLSGAHLEDARQVAERLRLRMQLADIPHIDRSITVSLGVAEWYPNSGITVEHVLKMADQALYAAKQQGRNRVVTAAVDVEQANLG
ncbi:diguanylate cyclase (GGDEF)-like protein [Azomonas agilis]|uniref:diguanylate cyclase n=2 Tax=Azomonas agilis TaxID=116849 RepID=A0A562J207_9GAMM|nr:diguanylate cyclase (GGDEF)-like protein [Azomonas agilis]